jgi:hypothetical protein
MQEILFFVLWRCEKNGDEAKIYERWLLKQKYAEAPKPKSTVRRHARVKIAPLEQRVVGRELTGATFPLRIKAKRARNLRVFR